MTISRISFFLLWFFKKNFFLNQNRKKKPQKFSAQFCKHYYKEPVNAVYGGVYLEPCTLHEFVTAYSLQRGRKEVCPVWAQDEERIPSKDTIDYTAIARKFHRSCAEKNIFCSFQARD